MKSLLTTVLVATMLAVPAVAQEDHPLGAPRNDLDRFYGLYGTPGDETVTGRNYRVAPANAPMWMERQDIPQGYLMLSPTWGGGQLWFMATVGDTRFERRLKGDFGVDTVVRLETGADGRAEAMVYEVGPDDRERLERLGDLPSNRLISASSVGESQLWCRRCFRPNASEPPSPQGQSHALTAALNDVRRTPKSRPWGPNVGY